jgi:hypothetical protein
MATPGPQPTIWDKLQRIDRRILYLVLLLVVAIPTLYPVNVPSPVMPMSQALWETIDQTPKDKIVLLSSTWDRGTRGESQGQFDAIVEHLMARRIRFMISSFVPPGPANAKRRIDVLAPKYDYQYGRDWISLGFQPSQSAPSFVKGMNVDIIGTVKLDSVNKKPLKDYPVMAGVRSIDDVHIVVECTASGSHLVWLQFLKSNVLLGFSSTSVMAPEALPYYASGQLSGQLWGAKGGYDYEQLNVKNGIGKFGFGRKYMGPLSFAFALVILSIVVGNVAMFMSKRQAVAVSQREGQ